MMELLSKGLNSFLVKLRTINMDDVELQYLLSLRTNLQLEIRGMKGRYKPTAYSQIKSEFNIRGSRKNVLTRFSAYIEERMNVSS